VAILIHGDGANDRWASDSYKPLVNTLLDDCIGVYSWDKPGVGDSTGHWLSQSMDDRAALAIATYDYLIALPALANTPIGYFGFSQAGWVIPKAATQVNPAYSVLVGAAVNFKEQGIFLTRQRLMLEGATAEEIETEVANTIARDTKDFGATKADAPQYSSDTPTRLGFVHLNYHADASDDIATMQGPVMAIWGMNDLNVDQNKNALEYAHFLPETEGTEIMQVPDATHGLLREKWFNYQTPSQIPLSRVALYVLLGRNAYQPFTLDAISSWIKIQTNQLDTKTNNRHGLFCTSRSHG